MFERFAELSLDTLRVFEAAARLREQAAGVEDKRLRESILKALEASEKPGSSKNGKSGL